MTYLSEADAARVLQVSWDLGGLDAGADLTRACLVRLIDLVGADVAGFNVIDPVARTASVVPYPDSPLGEVSLSELVTATVGDHPMIKHYLENPADVLPRRMSDVLPMRDWLLTRTYNEVFRALSMPYFVAVTIGRVGPGGARGYSLIRSMRDFTDRELDLVTALQPTLTALHLAHEAKSAPGDDREEARQRAGVTPRELDILLLLAAGLTADAIARAARLSPRTVRKHLEHIYSKLDRHDRLTAVTYARELGLVPTTRIGESG